MDHEAGLGRGGGGCRGPPKRLDLETTIAEFTEVLRERQKREADPVNKRILTLIQDALTYHLPTRYPEVRTLRDFDQFREEGLYYAFAHVAGVGPKSGDYLGRIFKEYGMTPIAWRTRKYRAYERLKQLNPVPEVRTDTAVDVFLAAAKNRHYRRMTPMGSGALVVLRGYLERHPEIQTVEELQSSLSVDGLLSLKEVGKERGIYFSKHSAQSINRVFARYGLPIIPWSTGGH